MARVTLPGGKRVTRYAADRAGAEQTLAALLTTPDLAPAAPYTVASWLDEYLRRENRGKAPSTVKDRDSLSRGIRESPLGRVRLDRLSPALVQSWADTLTGAHRTRLKRLQLLRSALNSAVILGHLTRNVAVPVKLERQPARMAGMSWTQVQARAFLDGNIESWHALLWTLGLQTGARIGELLALRVEDYDPAARTLRIERTVKTQAGDSNRTGVGPPKTPNAVRSVPLPPDACLTIQAQLQRRVWLAGRTAHWQDEGWLFPNEHGGLLMYSNVRREWAAALARAEVPRIRTHDMRVTFISLALRRGVKPEVVSKMVGHSSPVITLRIYRHVFQDELDETRGMLDGLV